MRGGSYHFTDRAGDSAEMIGAAFENATEIRKLLER
jgi:hypothetical protein